MSVRTVEMVDLEYKFDTLSGDESVLFVEKTITIEAGEEVYLTDAELLVNQGGSEDSVVDAELEVDILNPRTEFDQSTDNILLAQALPSDGDGNRDPTDLSATQTIGRYGHDVVIRLRLGVRNTSGFSRNYELDGITGKIRLREVVK